MQGPVIKGQTATLAQMVEQPIRNRQVSGSIPLGGSSVDGGFRVYPGTPSCFGCGFDRRVLLRVNPCGIFQGKPGKNQEIRQILETGS